MTTRSHRSPICWIAGGINKGCLVNLLRKHPDWDEDALAVKYTVSYTREVSPNRVFALRQQVVGIGRDFGLDAHQLRVLDLALSALTADCDQYLRSAQLAAHITELCGIACSSGQRTSRVISRVCKAFHLDEHPSYNAAFAQLADSLNPISIPRTGLLSVHPCDYLEMSNVDNSWSSCHNLEDGCYRAGTLSYLCDSTSMIFYTVEPEHEGMRYEAPKVTREVFCYGGGILLQSRLYPDNEAVDVKRSYRHLVQQTVALCEDAPNLWTRKSSDHVDDWVYTHGDALHYPDYSYEQYHANVSLLLPKEVEAGQHIFVGSPVHCLTCGDFLSDADSLFCIECRGDLYCEKCGDRIPRGTAVWIDGYAYCSGCVSTCELCDHTTVEELVRVQGIYVCSECFAERAASCGACGDSYLIEDMVNVDGTLYCTTCAGDQEVSA